MITFDKPLSTKDKMMDINVEESTVEIEPLVDYLELEVGPILKYMQYPSFDSDDENIADESTDDLLEGELGTHSDDENLVDESTDNFIEEEVDTCTYNGEQLRLDSTDDLVDKDMNVEDMHGHFDLDAYDDTGVDENIQDNSNDDHLEEYVNVDDDDKHGDLDLDDDNGTDTNVLDENRDNLYVDNHVHTGSYTGVVVETDKSEENVKVTFQDLNTEPSNRKVESLDNGNENEIEDEIHDSILEQELQLDIANKILNETKTKCETEDLDQTDNVSLEPDSHDPKLEGDSFDKVSETELVAEKLKGEYVGSFKRKNSVSKKEYDDALLDSQDRSLASFDSDLNEDAGDILYHRVFNKDGGFDDTEIFSGREELKMVEKNVGRQFYAKDGEGEIKESILDEDGDTSEPSETGYSEASTKTASDDPSESIEDTNDRKITVTVDDAYKSDSVFLHDASLKEAIKGGRNNVTGKKQKDLYLDQSRHVRNDRKEQFRHVKNDKEEQFRHMKNDRETFRQDRTKESYRERYTDDNEAIQRTQIEKSKVEDPFAGHRLVTLRNQIKSSDKQDAAYYVRKGDSIDLAESARYSMHKRKNIIKTPNKIRNSREKQLSFDTDTKFDNDYEGKITQYDKSSHRSVDKKYYRPKESMQRYDTQPEFQGKRQIETKEYHRTEEHNKSTNVKSLPANITEWDDREIKYSGTRLYEKPYAHVAGRFNYSNRPPRSQDALANRQHRNVRISRIPGQKKGEADCYIIRPGPEVIKLHSCSTQLRTKFTLLINILTFYMSSICDALMI